MIPSRPRLQSWNPDSLSEAAPGVTAGGASVYRAVRNLDDGVNRLDESRTWRGPAHDASTKMFDRATRAASNFKDFTEKVATAMQSGGASIAAARTPLLSKADEIDQGELHVTDQWVVLIKPAQMTAKKAADLQKLMMQEQGEINKLLLAVGQADDAAADAIQSAAKAYGFVPLQPGDLSGVLSGQARPGDEVPNPLSAVGELQQQMIRQQDMSTTVRETREWETSDGQHRKTITMLDGSRHEIYEWNDYCPCVSETYYDKNGRQVYSAFSQDNTRYDGTKMSSVTLEDGTEITMTQLPDGTCRGGIITPDGDEGILPAEFFTHPNLTVAGGMLTGIQEQAKQGIPMMTPSSMEGIAKGAKYGGYGLGIATAIYDTVTADTWHKACVAAVSGTAGIVGGDAGAVMLGGLVAETGPGAVFAAGAGNVMGTWVGGYLGGIIGNVVCPK